MKKTIAISLIVSSLLFATSSTVNNLEIKYKSTIKGGSSIDDSQVHQGKTSISSSTVKNVKLESLTADISNSIDSVDIEGSEVYQANFIVSGDSNATGGDADADDISIKSDNSIVNGSIKGGSVVKQTYTEIKGSSTVKQLEIELTNTIQGVTTDGTTNPSDINNSTISQGTLLVQGGTNGASEITAFTQTGISNTMDNVDTDNATLTQNSITVKDGTTITSFTNTHGSGATTNIMTNVDARDGASITQNTATFTNSTIANSGTKQSNSITDLTLDKNSVTQGNIEITNAEDVSGFETVFTNTIDDVRITGAGTTEQGVLIIGDSNATGTATDTTFADNIDITSTNTLQFSNLVDSNVTQSKTSILTGSSVSAFNLNQTNTIEGTDTSGNADTRDNNASKATISQAETTITNSIVDDFKQLNSENKITSSVINDSTVEQSKTDITNSDDVNHLIVNAGVNLVDDVTMENDSSLSQAGISITSSTVDKLTITQTNNVSESDILDHSTVTQGMTTITGS